MPSVGLGAFKSSPKDTAQAVAAALATGYHLIDTAAAYQNEAQVGEGYVAAAFRATGDQSVDVRLRLRPGLARIRP
jgi:diketogulonate reductase-like aldo/keto reductase